MPPMTPRDILIVEDERPIRELVGYTLRRAGYSVREAENAAVARERVAERLPDLLLVDWMLPGISGLELTRILKGAQSTRQAAVIMLTARAEEADRVAGLDGGADDYVTKPFSTRELLARIQTVLRRSAPESGSDDRIELSGLVLDRAAHRISVGHRAMSLSPSEYRILALLMSNAERAFTRNQILDRVWEAGTEVGERTVDVHIRRLRQGLEQFRLDHLVQSVRGVGYRFSTRIG
jgi:two-component system phosphate regulon response regulator PhoB